MNRKWRIAGFSVLWLLVGLVAVGLHLRSSGSWDRWTTAGVLVWCVVGLLLLALFLQRIRIGRLVSGAESDSADSFDQRWKAAFRSEARRNLSGGEPGSAAVVRRTTWVLSDDPVAAIALLEQAGAKEPPARTGDAVAEFGRGWAILGFGEDRYVVPRRIPEPDDPSSACELDLMVGILSEGRRKAVGGVLVLGALGTEIPAWIGGLLSELAIRSGLEFPVHLGFLGGECLPGSAAFSRICGQAPGTALAWSRPEGLATGLEDAWTRMETDLRESEAGLLARAWEMAIAPEDPFRFLEGLRSRKEELVRGGLRCMGGASVGTRPFLRSIHVLPSPRGGSRDSGVLFGDGTDPGEAGVSGDEAAVSAAREGIQRDFLAWMQAEDDLSRLGKGRRAKASTAAIAVFATCCLLSVALAMAAAAGTTRGASLRRDWSARLERARSAPWNDPGTMRKGLAEMEDLESILDEMASARWKVPPGFVGGSAIRAECERILDERTRALARAALASGDRDLRRTLSGNAGSGDLYAQLKWYLLASRAGWTEGVAKEGRKAVEDCLARSWAQAMGEASPPPFERQILSRLASRMADRIESGESTWLGSPDPALVARARERLRRGDDRSGSFARLVASADNVPGLDWDSLGIPQRLMSCRKFPIAPAFTRRGWLLAIRPALQAMLRGEGDWVVGGEGAPDAEGGAKAALELEDRYVDQYVRAWSGLFDSGACSLREGNLQVSSALADLASPWDERNPRGIAAFFRRILRETDLAETPDSSGKLQGKVAEAIGRIKGVARLAGREEPVEVRVARGLEAIRGAAAEVGKGALDGFAKDLGQAATVVGQCSDPESAFESVRAAFQKDPKSPLVHALNELSGREGSFPPQLKPWLRGFAAGLVGQAVSSCIPQARSRAQAAYRERILVPWTAAAKGRFPFDPSSVDDAAIPELESLVRPRGGAVSSFLREMQGLLVESGGAIRAGAFEGVVFPADPAGLEQIARIRRIGELFCGRDGAAWKGAQLTLSVRSDPRCRVVLRAGGQVLELPAGVERKLSLRWPLPGQGGATLQAVTVNRSFEERREGEWAVLRLLLDKSKAEGPAVASFDDRSYAVDVAISARLEGLEGPLQGAEWVRAAPVEELFR